LLSWQGIGAITTVIGVIIAYLALAYAASWYPFLNKNPVSPIFQAIQTPTPIPTASVPPTPTPTIAVPAAGQQTPSAKPEENSPRSTLPSPTQPTLPRAVTATPFLQTIIVTVTNDDATAQAEDYIRTHSIPIEQPAVIFTGDHLEFTGQVNVRRFVVTLESWSAWAIADPIVENDELRFNVTSMTRDGEKLTQEDYSAQLEHVLNDSFGHVLVGLYVQSVDITEGAINITALERK
jgi:hypothetical protein